MIIKVMLKKMINYNNLYWFMKIYYGKAVYGKEEVKASLDVLKKNLYPLLTDRQLKS